MKAIHIGSGIIIREVDDKSIKKKFAKVWPRDYAACAKEKNKQTREFVEHLAALTRVIESIWPSTTKEKFVGLLGLGGRYPFHQRRLDVLMNYLEYVWEHVVKDLKTWPFYKVKKDLYNSVVTRVSKTF